MTKPTRRRWYISGRYRHYNADGSYAWGKMNNELRDEAYWSALVAFMGHSWYPPVTVTKDVEAWGILEGHQFVDFDLELLSDYRPGYDGMLMRPGWRAHDDLLVSVGATAEHKAATDRGLLMLEPLGDRVTASIEVISKLQWLGADWSVREPWIAQIPVDTPLRLGRAVELFNEFKIKALAQGVSFD